MLELSVELLRALPRLRGGGAQLLEVAPRCRDRVALGRGALTRGFHFGRQLDDPLLALAEHRARPFRRGQRLASGALRGLELGARRRKLRSCGGPSGVRLVQRLVERRDLARQRLDSSLDLERLLGRGVVFGLASGRELGLELVDLALALGEQGAQILGIRTRLRGRLGRDRLGTIGRRRRR